MAITLGGDFAVSPGLHDWGAGKRQYPGEAAWFLRHLRRLWKFYPPLRPPGSPGHINSC